MGIRMTGKSVDATTTEITHGPSGATLRTTAPRDNGGDGSTFSPTDLCAASLAACGSTIMTMFARKHGIDARIEFEVTKEMHGTPRRLGRLAVSYVIAAACDDEFFGRIVEAGRTCPVRLSLGPQVEVVESYRRAD